MPIPITQIPWKTHCFTPCFCIVGLGIGFDVGYQLLDENNRVFLYKKMADMLNKKPIPRLIRLIEITPSMMKFISRNLIRLDYPTSIIALEYRLTLDPPTRPLNNEDPKQAQQTITELVYSVFRGMQEEFSNFCYNDGYYYRCYFLLKRAAAIIDWPFSLQPMIQLLEEKMEKMKSEGQSEERRMFVLSIFEIMLPFIQHNPKNIHLDNPSDLCRLIFEPLSFIHFSSPFALLLQFLKALQKTDLILQIGNSIVVNILEVMSADSYIYHRWCYLKLIETIVPYLPKTSTMVTNLWEAYKSIVPILDWSRYPKARYPFIIFVDV